MRKLAVLAVTSLVSQFAFAAATVDRTPTVNTGTAEAALVRNEVLADDPANRPPAGMQLAFVRDDQIFLVNADGTGLAQLTNTRGGVANWDPAWSRDGQRLAFARGSSDPRSSDVYVMDADGSNEVRLTREGYNVEPAWGPDGRTIVFTSWTFTKGAGLSVVDVDANGSQGSGVLLDFPGWDTQPAWSPDGQTITFTSDSLAYDFVYDLYAMNADGSNIRLLLQGPLLLVDGPTYYFQSAWSPDGQSIGVVICAYAVDDCYPDSAIAVANPDGSGLRVIAQAGSFAGPTWSSDGRWIAYGSSRCRTCQSSVRFVHVDGGTEGLMVENGHSPAWRPETGARIDVGHSGAWFNPATRGQGQFLEIEPDKQFVFLSWFTYTDDASDTPNQQHWFTAEGNYNGSKAELILYESVGGRFDQPQAVTTTPIGDVTLTFSDCGHGTMSYRFDDRDLVGSIPMMRTISGSGNVCESRTDSTTQAVSINHGMDGAWSDPNTPGQGFFFDVHAGEDGSEFIFVSWLTYGDDTASGQRWLTAQGPFEGTAAEIIVYETTGGSFDDPETTTTDPVGTLSIDFTDCSNAILIYSLTEEGLESTIDIQRTIPGTQALCLELAGQD